MIAQLNIITTIPIAAHASVSFAFLIRSAFPPEVSIINPPQINIRVATIAIVPRIYRITCEIKQLMSGHLIGLGIETPVPVCACTIEGIVTGSIMPTTRVRRTMNLTNFIMAVYQTIVFWKN